jgi:hypothetical protein
LNSFKWTNSEFFTSLCPPEGLNDKAEIYFLPDSDLRKYLPGSINSSPIAFEVNLLNGSAVIRLPLLFEKFLNFPISYAGLLSF